MYKNEVGGLNSFSRPDWMVMQARSPQILKEMLKLLYRQLQLPEVQEDAILFGRICHPFLDDKSVVWILFFFHFIFPCHTLFYFFQVLRM